MGELRVNMHVTLDGPAPSGSAHGFDKDDPGGAIGP